MSSPAEPPPPMAPVLLLAVIGGEVRARLDVALNELDLSLRHLGALGHIRADPGLSVTGLAQRGRVSPPSMHATLRDLEGRGFVDRPSTGRGRRAEMHITVAGEAALEAGMQAVSSVDQQMATSMGDEAYAALTSALMAVLMSDQPG